MIFVLENLFFYPEKRCFCHESRLVQVSSLNSCIIKPKRTGNIPSRVILYANQFIEPTFVVICFSSEYFSEGEEKARIHQLAVIEIRAGVTR